ncbi:MAG: hypothetical protein HY666_04830 [Chloroflexi bacterium]|nr:hypothetical protein [Chloroflexota bacterium]
MIFRAGKASSYLLAAFLATTLLVVLGCGGATPTLTVPPTPTATPKATLVPTLTPFSLTLITPEDETIVTTNTISVTGETAPDAVVSINGVLVEVDADGRFNVLLVLDEGPNTIQIVASDFSGNMAQEVRTVVFVP